MIPSALAKKKNQLERQFSRYRRVAIAFSGGVDSTYLLYAAAEALGRENVLAVIGDSFSLAERERQDAIALAAHIGVRHHLVDPGEFDDSNYLANPTNRCFYCKTALYTCMADILREHSLDIAFNGTNADDLSDYRPGLKAASDHGIASPLADAGLTKADIRALSKVAGLPTHDKPAAPCLSSRVQYGESITPEKLKQIERAESFLHGLGFRECRVRHHDNLARIEVPRDRIAELTEAATMAKVDAALREFGYQFVTVDLRGFRSGSLNEVIAFGVRQA